MVLVAVNVSFECMLRKASKNIQIPSGKRLIVLRVDCCQSHYPLHMVVRQYTGKTCLPLLCIKIFLMWHIWFFSSHPPNYMFFFCIQKGKKQPKNKNQNKQNDKTKRSKQTHTHTNGVHFVLINYSQAWCLPWNVVDTSSDISHSQELSIANSFLVRAGILCPFLLLSARRMLSGLSQGRSCELLPQSLWVHRCTSPGS